MSVLLMVALNSPIQSNHCSGSPSNMNGLTMGVGRNRRLVGMFQGWSESENKSAGSDVLHVDVLHVDGLHVDEGEVG